MELSSQYLNRIKSIIGTPSAFKEAIFNFAGLSSHEKKHLNETVTSSKCFRETRALIEKKKVVPNPKPKNEIDHRVLDLYHTIGVILTYLGKPSLDEVTLDEWVECIRSVKEENDRYQDSINEKLQVTFRRTAEILDLHNTSLAFKQVARVPRKRRDSDFYGHNAEVADKHKYRKWIVFAKEWIDSKVVKSTKPHWKAVENLFSFLDGEVNSEDPFTYLKSVRKKIKSGYIDFCEPLNENNHSTTIRHTFAFTSWLALNCYEYESDNNEDERLGTIPTRHEFELFCATPQKKPITLSESPKIKIPTPYLFKLKDILTQNNYAWPKSLESEHIESVTGKTVWCPVNTFMALTMLEIPIRRVQVAMLDSGEGDTIKYDIGRMEWTSNDGKNASYWSNTGSKKTNRGVIKRLDPHNKTITSLYINTNKTADKKEAHGVNSGFTIPWHNINLVSLFTQLRSWQEEHNPVSGPAIYASLPSYITGDSKPSLTVLKNTPDRFYLFRHPRTKGGVLPFSPLPHHEFFRFWWKLMEKLETELNHEYPERKFQIITNQNPNTGTPEGSIFTPHGLRVSNITAFLEAGVPIEIISKIVVGHASIAMTVRYVKHDQQHIAKTLSKAQKKIEDLAKSEMSTLLEGASWDTAREYAVSNSESGLRAMVSGPRNSATWAQTSLGICPYGGTRCNDGGKPLRQDGRKTLYAPVEGGEGNCIQCRHLVTGLPWLTEIWLYINKLFSDIRNESIKEHETREKYHALILKRRKLILEDGDHETLRALAHEEAALERLIQDYTAEIDLLARNAHAAYRVLEKIRALKPQINSKPGNGEVAKIDDEAMFDLEFTEETAFSTKHQLVVASRLYPHLCDERMELERDKFIDQILFNNQATPISLANLSKEEKRRSIDAMGDFLLAKLSTSECEDLHDNHATLEELGLSIDDLSSYKESRISVKDDKDEE